MAEGIYKWVDENGQMHFSDVPKDGAEELDISPAQTFSSPGAAVSTSAADQTSEIEDDDAVKYESLVVTNPTTEETIWNTGGTVTVGVYLKPGLEVGHEIVVSLDGETIRVPPRSSTVQLTDVVRGEHTIRAEVLNESGEILISSDPVKFFYQQTSVNRR